MTQGCASMEDRSKGIIEKDSDWREIQSDAQWSMRVFDRLPPLTKQAVAETGTSPHDAEALFRDKHYTGQVEEWDTPAKIQAADSETAKIIYRSARLTHVQKMIEAAEALEEGARRAIAARRRF